MKLSIISPETAIEHNIAWIELPTSGGSIVIQRGHEPLLAMLTPHQHVTFKLKTGKQRSIIVQHGIARVEREAVTLIAQISQLYQEG